MKNLASNKLHPNLGWLSKNFKCNNLHQVSLPISWGKYEQISQSCIKFAKVSYPVHSDEAKKILWKDFIQGWIFTQVQAHCERRFTVCSQSGMEMEPEHFKAILMRTLALKSLQTHCLHSQDTSRRKEERPEGNHICKKPEAWEDSWQTSMQVLARNSTNQFK